ncbi:MAG TPA: hypothetical protein VG475_05080, partial [Pseudolabrys sp.]|nr:hypothetical protein [Pseudolabrys sp.]
MAKTDTDKRKLHADRLAAALRDNLKRRKAQERARNQGTRDQGTRDQESGIENQVSGRPVP